MLMFDLNNTDTLQALVRARPLFDLCFFFQLIVLNDLFVVLLWWQKDDDSTAADSRNPSVILSEGQTYSISYINRSFPVLHEVSDSHFMLLAASTFYSAPSCNKKVTSTVIMWNTNLIWLDWKSTSIFKSFICGTEQNMWNLTLFVLSMVNDFSYNFEIFFCFMCPVFCLLIIIS